MTIETSTIIGGDYKPKSSFLQRNFHWLIFIPFLLLGAYLRHFGFFLPSHIGDSTAYQSLAMKMNYGFMRQYDIYNYNMVPRKEPGLVDYIWETDPNKWNARRIRQIYHTPLHIQPPLYPILIWLSHGIFNHSQPYTSVSENLGWSVIKNPPWHFLRAQFYAIIIPYFFSILLLILVYFFCLRFYSYREGLFAVLLLISSPVDLAISPKLYSDGILSTLSFLSLYAYFCSLESKGRKSWLFATLAGLALGLSYLTKVTGVLFGFGMFVATLLHPKGARNLLKKVFEPRLLLAAVVTILVASPWLALMYHYYGSMFLNTPADPNNSWYHYVFGRPLYVYPLDMSWFIPAMIIGWGYGISALARPSLLWKESSLFLTALFYLLMFMLFVKTGTAGVEDRYLLPIYPLLAILTARGLVQILNRLNKSWLRNLGYAFVVVGLVILGWRSTLMGLNTSFSSLTVFSPFRI